MNASLASLTPDALSGCSLGARCRYVLTYLLLTTYYRVVANLMPYGLERALLKLN